MGRDFVPGYPSPYYLRVPITIVLWTCAQEKNSLKPNLVAIVSENLSNTVSHCIYMNTDRQKDGLLLK